MNKWIVAALAGVLLMACTDEATKKAQDHALVVADSNAGALYVYDAKHVLQQTITSTAMADHVGFLPLGDGRLLFVDPVNYQLVELDVKSAQDARVVWRAELPEAASYAHLAVDADHRYAVVSGSNESYDEVTLSLVTLADHSVQNRKIRASEAGLAFAFDPLRLYVREGGNPDASPPIDPDLRVFDFAALLAGDTEPLVTMPLGNIPHGEGLVEDHGKFYVASDEGLEIISLDDDKPTRTGTLSWDVDGRSGGRAYYLRLSQDARHIISYIREDSKQGWELSKNDAYVVDLETEQARRIELGAGLSYRCAQGGDYALYYRLHPDGDQAFLLNTNPKSSSYLQMEHTIALPALADAAPAGGSVWEVEGFRATAISPDGKTAYVSNGSNGTISVIDTAKGEIVHTIDTPSKLSFGGYMTTVGAGAAGADTIGR